MQATIQLSLDLGMNRASFAEQNSFGSSIFEESWRRTYWELYVVEGLLAAMRDQSTFRLYSQKADVSLPCDEESYNRSESLACCNQNLEDLRHNWSYGENQQIFSSFAYRVDTVRVLGMVLEINHSLEIDVQNKVETADASLAASLMHLPSSQHDVYGTASEEMTFQIQMIIYLGMIHLHHPRSNMRFACFHAETSCTRLRALCGETFVSADLDLHSQKLLRAANMLSNLATLPTPVRQRTPFFTCALAMCVIVHTAACLMAPVVDLEESLKARIQLGVGGLNVLGRVWPMAKMAKQQVVGMYQEVGLQRR
ncbi:hypothetical protein AWENTII_008323 [Aspergillus wentii]|nr:hypothetical protein MW887_008246 [Aspergillus wentii]